MPLFESTNRKSYWRGLNRDIKMREFRFFRGFCLILLQISSASSDFFPIKAMQSGDYADTAMNAIDNNSSTCCLAAEGDVPKRNSSYGWLQVDLGNLFLITSVTLTNINKNTDSKYLQNFVIFVSRSSSTDVAQSSGICAQFNNGSWIGDGATITFTCNSPIIGRYVTIKRQGGYRQDAIAICEVSITHNPSEGFIYLYNLPTNQIGAYDGQFSDRAVDLDVNSCAMPVAADGAKGWWSIYLQTEYVITRVIVFNGNNGSTGYAKEFGVWVGSETDANSRSLCNNFTGSIPVGGNVTLNCNQPSVGRFVNITRWGSDNTKTIFLCEIYIKGYLRDGTAIPSSTSVTTNPDIRVSSPSTRTPTITGSTVGPSWALETPGFTISSNPSAFSCCNCESSDRVAGLTAAVIVLAILLGVTAIALALLVVYTLRKSNRGQDSSRLPASAPTPATGYPPPRGANYEKLRRGLGISESSMTSIQAAVNVGDAPYEEVGVY